MPTLTPVDFDPFGDTKSETKPVAGPPGVKLTPVEGNPFGEDERGAVAQEGPPGATKAQSILEGYLTGASANFRDEIYGASKASGLPDFLGGFRAPIGGARLLYENTLGTPGDVTKQYEAARDQKRAEVEAARKANPGLFLGSEIGGAVAMPVAKIGQAASLGGRIGQGALLGAAYGGAAGAGAGETLDERLKGAGTGAALGGLVGGAAAPATDAVMALGRAATSPLRGFRGAINPEAEAAKRVATALERDAAADPNAVSRMTPTEFQATPNAAVVDLGGETTRGLARSAANTSPEARTALDAAVDPRYAAQGDRITGWLDSNFNFPNAKVQRDAIEATARATNKTAYEAAEKAGAAPFATPEMGRLAQSDAVQAAMKKATSAAQDEAIMAGGNKMQPYDLKYWDLVRRELSDEAYRVGANTAEGRRLNHFAKALNKEIDSAVPEYAAARKGAHEFFQAENALEAGENFVRLNKGMDEAKDAISKMSTTEKRLFQDGFVSRYVETLKAIPDRRNVLNSIMQSPAAKEKIEIALGKQKATELEALLRVEGLMNLPRQAIQGNSTTTRQLMELGLAGGVGAGGLGVSMYSGDPKHIGLGLLGAALLRGRYKIDQNVSSKVGQMLASKDQKVFEQGIKRVAASKGMMDALRSVDMSIARAGAEQTQ